LKVNELIPGDRVNDHRNGQDFWLEVISTRPDGRMITVTFQSSLGSASACYNGNAFIPALRTVQ
jgi:hypothetical protein